MRNKFSSLTSNRYEQGNMEGITIDEMNSQLELPLKTVAIRIHRAGIKPMTRQAVYPPDTPNKIKDVSMGRPGKLETKTKINKSKPVKKKIGRMYNYGN